MKSDQDKENKESTMNRSLYRSISTQLRPLPYPNHDFTGKTVLITGANTGLGLEAARHFVRLNARKVILGCRDLQKGNAAKQDIERTQPSSNGNGSAFTDVVEIWQVQLHSSDSVKAFCRRAAHTLDRLDIVVENAGVLSQLYNLAEGYEWQTKVNVISTWLMALLLLPVLRATKVKYYRTNDSGKNDDIREGSEVPHLVIVGSNAHFYTKFEARNETSIFEVYKGGSDLTNRYANTKLMSLFVAREVANRMVKNKDKPQVVLNIVEPGYCRSQLMREQALPWYFEILMIVGFATVARTSEQGSRTYLSAATAGWESHGMYLEDCKLSAPHEFVDSEEGRKIQTKVYNELMAILEQIEPGILQNI
ncbi:hypothetical protein M434DRAFT_28508 [Hypoxylon sp. CO27-5]|nr:hypothetical protein M434DRAFT_28508 [Hypoxylon sp. CO27-5]